MSESSTIEVGGGQLQDFTIDQFAGASALILGSVGGLLMIIWKSRCACRMRLGCSDKCYLFDCERAPPPDDKDSDDEEKGKGKDKQSNGQSPKDKSKKPKPPEPPQVLEPDSETKEPESEVENLM